MSIAEQEPTTSSDEVEADSKPTSAKRTRWKLCALGCALIAVVVAFLPSIIASTALRHKIVPILLPQFEGRVEISSASLGWFSPIQLQGFVIEDEKGQALARGRSFMSTKTLWSFLTDSSNLDELTIIAPEIHMVARPGGSNIEDAIAPLLNGTESSGGVTCKIVVEDGTLIVSDSKGRGQTKFIEWRSCRVAVRDVVCGNFHPQPFGCQSGSADIRDG